MEEADSDLAAVHPTGNEALRSQLDFPLSCCGARERRWMDAKWWPPRGGINPANLAKPTERLIGVIDHSEPP